MRFVRMYTGDDGQTHFADLPIDFSSPTTGVQDPGTSAGHLELAGIQGGRLQRNPPGLSADYHIEPRRQLVVYLTGSRQMISSTGDNRIIQPGDILLAEDTSGRGHRTTAIAEPQQFLLLYLDPEVKVDDLFSAPPPPSA